MCGAALAAQFDAGRLYSAANLAIDANHRDIRRARANEDFPHIRFRSAMPKIGDQSLSHQLHQRQNRTRAGLGVADMQNLAAPVGVLKP